jgi:histidinol-phosphate/aromatic aminotransferase/cobyric acid decarboxylase-like protein
VLVELLTHTTADEFVEQVLVDHGVYLRSCRDKIGLEGEFVRVAGRNEIENRAIIAAFRAVLMPQ